MSQADPRAEIRIRRAIPEDAQSISDLIHRLAHYAVEKKVAAQDEETATFFRHISVPAISEILTANNYNYFVAEANQELNWLLVGTVGIRDNNHLYHFWVDEGFHGQGVGRLLWQEAKADALNQGSRGRFTVSASLFAVPIYQRLGFVINGPETHQHGVVFVPMILEPPPPKP